jgi:predicted PurR-regulated permease PerM
LNIDTVGLKAWIVLTLDDLVNSSIRSIPGYFLNLVITLNGMYYILCNWDSLESHLKRYLPFKNSDRMMGELGATSDSIIKSNILISVIEGVASFVGFTLIGIQAPLIFSILIFILAILPGIGVELVWIPMTLYYLSSSQYFVAIGVVAIGLFLNLGIEMFFSPRFIGGRSHIHPFILLIGVFGGILVFGIFGFVIGPLLLAVSISLIEGAIDSRENGKNKPSATNLKS